MVALDSDSERWLREALSGDAAVGGVPLVLAGRLGEEVVAWLAMEEVLLDVLRVEPTSLRKRWFMDDIYTIRAEYARAASTVVDQLCCPLAALGWKCVQSPAQSFADRLLFHSARSVLWPLLTPTRVCVCL